MSNGFEEKKQEIIRRNQALTSLLDSSALSSHAIKEVYEFGAQYFFLQSKAFYTELRNGLREDRSSLTKIEYFENDLVELKIKMFSYLEADSRLKKRASYQKLGRELFNDFVVRLNLERKFLFPLFPNKETIVAKM